VVGGGNVIQDAEPVPLLGLKKPIDPAPAV
jgi:hypothetical protein